MMKAKIYTRMAIIIWAVFLLALPAQGAQTTAVIGDDAAPLDGSGTGADPYRYLIDEDSRVAWKHLLDLRDQGSAEVYEYRDGHTVDGDLRYSFTFSGPDISPHVSGPYFLAIRTYDREATEGLPGYPGAMFFSFATKRDFPGKTAVTLNVSDKFSDGARLDLTYYGGYDATVIHGAAPPVARDEILQVASGVVRVAEGLTVDRGLVAFDVRYGGNYVLHAEPVDFSGFGAGDVIHYHADRVLGSIRSVFPTVPVAEAVAAALGKKKEDTVTQGDIDSIKSLYLSASGLKSAAELERVYFARLESLTLSENELESLNSLSMPGLTYLDAGGNRLTSVNALAGLTALENVNLAGNDLRALPDLNKLVHLQTLDLSDNRLEIIPALASGRLRYLDLSGNSVARIAGGLEECPNLATVVLAGQALHSEAQVDPGEDFHLEPEPRLIAQFGNGGTVTVTDDRGREIYAGDFSVVEADGFCLSGALFAKPGRYTVTVRGAVAEEGTEKDLGVYTYALTAGGGSGAGTGARRMAALALLIILPGFGWGLVRHARRQKKRNGENGNE